MTQPSSTQTGAPSPPGHPRAPSGTSRPDAPGQPGTSGRGDRGGPAGRGNASGNASLTKAIPRRPRVGVVAGLLLAIGFGLVITPTIGIDTWLIQLGKLEVSPSARAAVTVRVPLFAGHRDGSMRVDGGGVLISRGEVFGRDRAAATAEIYATTPRGLAPFIAYFLLCAALVAVTAHHLRRSNRGRLLRVQVVHLVVLAGVAILTKIALLTTSVSVLAVPVAMAAIVPTLVFDRSLGLATGVLSAVVISLLVPFDVGVATVLVAQAATAGLLVPESPKRPLRAALIAGVASAFVAAFIYGVFTFLTTSSLPMGELTHPTASAWVAAAAGGLLSAVLSVVLLPIYQILVGELTSGRLTLLQDLSNPLLRQIAEKSPGTWQHSLAMANMAEVAANEIGANGRLVRVGAYYHDLGKSLQAKYFIENIQPGETSPHEHLPPEVSCDAIFAHVTEGIVAARRAKLHERVIDFMHMHHGNGVLEYFWTKCQRQGNPKQLGVESFRYPGVPPQSRETAILAICDAVEAAARTLKKPDAASIDSLVQRIVYGKLHLGQLDESGLSMADLRRISDSLRETIRHAHHGRIEYPWQQEQARAAAEAAEAERSSGGVVRAGEAADDRSGERSLDRSDRSDRHERSGRFEPRLDSLDAPRPPWISKPRTADGRARSEVEALAVATTAQLDEAAGLATTGAVVASQARASDPSRGARRPTSRPPPSGGSASSSAAQAAQAALAAQLSSSRSASPTAPPTSAPEGLPDVAISSRVTRRGLGPPPAPGAAPALATAADDARSESFSDPAITTPRMTAPQPLADSSLARRIDASLAAMSDGEEEDLFDSPFPPRDEDELRQLERAVPRPTRRDPSVVTSAPRKPRPSTRTQPAEAPHHRAAPDAPGAPNVHDVAPRDVFAEMARGRSAAEFAAETSPAMPTYPHDADVTSQQPLAELEELAARSAPTRANLRRARDTHEIEADDIEAAIEVHPPARRNPGSVVQRLPRPPGKPK